MGWSYPAMFVYNHTRSIDSMAQKRAEERIAWVDWMRVAACFMVIVVHSTEPFYLGGEGSLVLTRADACWVAIIDALVRTCVPLFVVASSYLQFPLRYTAKEFFRRRAGRLLAPFVLWSVIYAVVWGNPTDNLQNLLFNFNYAAGHLWFVYMLVGLYLLMPLLSPWAERVGRRELLFYLALCALTTLVPIMRDALSGGAVMPVVYGVSGIPRATLTPLWGEASWNNYGVFYYVSGFVGYMLLGLYLRRFVGELSWRKTLMVAVPCFVVGFTIAFGGLLRRMLASAQGVFPVGGDVSVAVWWETTIGYDTLGVMLMCVAWLLLFKRIKCCGGLYRRLLLPISKASYGIYLMHMLLLVPIFGAVRGWLGSGAEGLLGVWTTPVEILLSALLTMFASIVVATLLQRIPKVGRWLVG